MRLENWAIVSSFDPYQAPELAVCRLQGNVYGHPKFTDGEVITTSEIVKVTDQRTSIEEGRVIIGIRDTFVTTTSGSRYCLGSVNEEYEKAFPNALARLISAISK